MSLPVLGTFLGVFFSQSIGIQIPPKLNNIFLQNLKEQKIYVFKCFI